ncbi:MAG: WecB/TagA/CpsF family glycosyltransferase [Victivallaceae bacterium]
MDLLRYRVLGTPVDAVGMTEALEYVREAVRTRTSPGFILAVNPEKVFVLRQDVFLKDFFERAALLIPDGIGMVKALRILFGVKVSRCPGADLMQNICREAPQYGYRIFIYGASEEVNRESCEILRQTYPDIVIAGRANGFVKPAEMDGLIRAINESRADILFVAMGSPRQEKWMSDHAAQLTSVKICQGIGGTLDTIVGTVKRAPQFWQRLGLEWFFRLLCQPSRFKRQLRCFRFAAEVYREKLFGKNHEKN